jgi:hypothetical protein
MCKINLVKAFYKAGQMRLFALLAFAFILAFPAACGDTLGRVRFSWDAVVNPVVSGTKVYWGTASGAYPHTVDAGNVTEVIIGEFPEGFRIWNRSTYVYGEASPLASALSAADAAAPWRGSPEFHHQRPLESRRLPDVVRNATRLSQTPRYPCGALAGISWRSHRGAFNQALPLAVRNQSKRNEN